MDRTGTHNIVHNIACIKGGFFAFFRRANEESEEHAKQYAYYAGYWRKAFEPSFTGRVVAGLNSSDLFDDLKYLRW